ncbi:MAG: cell division protein FtsK [Acidobacteria bacterium]|nr:MAG: cell division protein FtsK [Acidobacteriota bacterium]
MAAKRHEIVGILLLAVTVALLLCLVSYSPLDSSLNSLTHKTPADNTIGRIGAEVSDRLFTLLGLSAFLLLFPLAIAGWKLLWGREIEGVYVRALGMTLLVSATSTTLELIPFRVLRDVNFPQGGIAGYLLKDLLLPNLNLAGTILVVATAFVLGVLATTPLTLSGWVGRLSAHDQAVGPGLLERFRKWRAARRARGRTVVSIKPVGLTTLELTPRPQPVRAAAAGAESRATPGAAVQPEAAPAERPHGGKYAFPEIGFLTAPQEHVHTDEAELLDRARRLEARCAEFDVHGSINQIHPGPVVTTFEFKPDAGIKYSRITNLVDDLCLGIKAESVRIDRLPGKATVGIEVPNNQRETIFLREVIESEAFRNSQSKLTLALGKLINGTVYVTDLTRMPHLLIAGSTGSGKSVALNCMITSILYKSTPDEVKFIFIDPKRLELGLYAEVPHLLTPIVTDPKEASSALRWATGEMETRYKKLALRGVRSIDQYNALLRSTGRRISLEGDGPVGAPERPLPYVVLVIDELADLMMISGREVEESISRLAAMARAVGIHLILATQRPSVDVITGVIKANFPCRIAFKVATRVDSRTIIDSNGAEQLLGNGDMLFIPPGTSRLTRIHGGYVSEKEAQLIVEHLRRQGPPAYDQSVLTYGQEETDDEGNPIDPNAHDQLYNDAVRVVVSEGRASTSLLQRRLSIGYGRAAKLIDMMYRNNLVGPADGSKPREVLVGFDFLERLET